MTFVSIHARPCRICGRDVATLSLLAGVASVHCPTDLGGCGNSGLGAACSGTAVDLWNGMSLDAAQGLTWMPIDTAPQDGSTIVAARDEHGVNAPALIFWDAGQGWCGLTADAERIVVMFPPTHWLCAVPGIDAPEWWLPS